MNQEGAKGQCRASPSSEHVDDIEPYRDFLAELKGDERSLVVAAIEGIADQAENPKFKAILVQMKKDVESGKQFSDALMRYPKVFSPLYINMVKASELSGGFSKMLDRIAACARAAA